jgi:hypothetical protein
VAGGWRRAQVYTLAANKLCEEEDTCQQAVCHGAVGRS